MDPFMKSLALFLVLFNPFLMSIYLLDLIQDLDYRTFFRVLVRATLISASVFMLFAWGGEAIFTNLLQVRFEAFLVFGGIVISLIALQMMFTGSNAIRNMRGGDPEHISGSIAMPFMIGPGTISASVVIGKRLDPLIACTAVLAAVATFIVVVVALKLVHDYVRPRSEPLVQRYIEIAGRIMALFVGTISVEMIMQGIRAWAEKF